MSTLPTGTVTFLFTDIEGSTKLAQENPEAWESWRERHHAILRSAIESQHGYVFQIIGDAFCASFHTVGAALQAAINSQRRLQKELFEFCILQFQKANHLIGVVHTIEGLANLNVYQGQPKRAAQFFAWADAMRETIGDQRPPVEQASVERDLAIIHSKMEGTEFTRLSAEGRTMTVEQAIALAFEA